LLPGFVVSYGRLLPVSSGGFGFFAGILGKNEPISLQSGVAVVR
jgi:hypothetical protein